MNIETRKASIISWILTQRQYNVIYKFILFVFAVWENRF